MYSNNISGFYNAVDSDRFSRMKAIYRHFSQWDLENCIPYKIISNKIREYKKREN
ncbi:hypothetical protein J2741_000442 [Methanolinea mesophila]|nr:hypothetical protein [Methanolinea mesophila]